MTTPSPQFERHSGRREFLRQAGGGFGMLGLASLLASDGLLPSASAAPGFLPAASPLAPKQPDFAPRAKRIIWLFMHGGPSHVDLFDPKPDLVRLHGEVLPDSFGEVMTRRKVAKNPLLGPIRMFRKRGESGLEISDFLPNIAEHADKLCVLRSCHGDSVNHPQSVIR